jgi:tetratricopeptide (TPR) repeat protein
VSLRIAASRSGATSLALFFTTLLAFAAGPENVASAQGTPSPSDISAARALFANGVKLQEAGKPAEALELFRRADRVYAAPTIQLHLAECQALVGQLVESSETYRRLINTQLPSDASAPFRAAQTQAQSELPAVDARVPQLRVDVAPANLDGLEVQVDGIVLNAALVGVSRPINPGEHKVSATATGYAPAETAITIPERKKDAAVSLTLTPGRVGAGGYVNFTRGPGVPPPPPPLEVNGAYSGVGRPEDSRFGFILGGRGGINLLGGSLDGPNAIKTNAGAGASIGIEGGLRFARRLYLGATFEYAGYSGGNLDASRFSKDDSVSQSANSEYFGLALGFMSHPTSVAGFYGELGAGYRLFNYSATDTDGEVADSFNFGGVEGQVGAGMTIRAGKSLLFIPKVDVNLGSFSVLSSSCATAGCKTIASTTDANPFHTVILLALGVYFDKDY